MRPPQQATGAPSLTSSDGLLKRSFDYRQSRQSALFVK
jgi:hypothetical protein